MIKAELTSSKLKRLESSFSLDDYHDLTDTLTKSCN